MLTLLCSASTPILDPAECYSFMLSDCTLGKSSPYFFRKWYFLSPFLDPVVDKLQCCPRPELFYIVFRRVELVCNTKFCARKLCGQILAQVCFELLRFAKSDCSDGAIMLSFFHSIFDECTSCCVCCDFPRRGWL